MEMNEPLPNYLNSRIVIWCKHIYKPWTHLVIYIISSCGCKESFAKLATLSFRHGLKLYKYRPKFHLGVHLALNLGPSVALNPLCTWAFDLVGCMALSLG